MATAFAVNSGNWSNTATWSGSYIPQPGDDVFTNNRTVNIDVSFEVSTLRNTSGTGITAGGTFNFNSGSISGSATAITPLAGTNNLITVTATTGSVTFNMPNGNLVGFNILSAGNLINYTGNCNFNINAAAFGISNAGYGSATNLINKSSAGILTVTGSLVGGSNGGGGGSVISATNGNVIVVGNVTSGQITGIAQTAGNLTVTGNVAGAAGQGITFSGTSMTVNGNIIGGPSAVGISSTGPVFVVGNVTGSAFNGISTTAPVIVTGSVVATGAAAAISSTSAIFINVSGSVQASATANGISSTNASAVVNLAGNLINVNGKQAIYCQNLFLSNTQTTQARFFTFGGSDRTLYSSDTFPNLPSASNVRFGTTYGPGSGNTGTLRMASPQDVRSGVLTDNTTGSAILSMESLSNEIQTSSDPFAQRLKNLTTVDIIGNLLTAFKK